VGEEVTLKIWIDSEEVMMHFTTHVKDIKTFYTHI
jgi:hypothetical protein